jgi:hypothetical protein
VEDELLNNFSGDIALLVMHKLRTLIDSLNFNTHKKSIAIYVSPVFEKVLYLDIAVEEKIIVDESFEIRDLVYCKKQSHKYLVLVLSSKESRIFLGNSGTFVRIVSNTPESVYAYINEVPERVASFLDMTERKQRMLDMFLRHADNGLDIILNAYHLPLFVMGIENTLEHFKKLTRHQASIIEYIHGNYEKATTEELKTTLGPYIEDWKKVKEKDLLNQLDEAAAKKKLVYGIKQVWREAMAHKGSLLVVEKNYMFATQHTTNENKIDQLSQPYNKFSYIKDAVDDAMEKVLEAGGDVEFVEEGLLKQYEHIAFIKYY